MQGFRITKDDRGCHCNSQFKTTNSHFSSSNNCDVICRSSCRTISKGQNQWAWRAAVSKSSPNLERLGRERREVMI
jgi:hypothetical protein